MRQIIEDYKKSLKPNVTEEFINIVFFRPLAFLLVLPVKNINFSPNYYTSVSLLCGIASGVCFGLGKLELGALLLIIMIIFDCSDGQLARVKEISTRYGKMYDGVADILSYNAMLMGLAYHQFQRFPDFVLVGISAFIVLALNVFFFDQFKNQYIGYIHYHYGDKLQSQEDMLDHYRSSRGFKRAANYSYYQIYRFEVFLTKLGCLAERDGYSRIFQATERPIQEISDLYKRTFHVSVRLWSLIGTSTHFFVVAVLVLFGKMNLVFPVFFIYSGVCCILLIIYQNVLYSRFMRLAGGVTKNRTIRR